MKKVKMTIEGMHCASCGGNVENALKKVKGVSEARVSVMTNKGIIQVEDYVTEKELVEAISKVGYKVVKVE